MNVPEIRVAGRRGALAHPVEVEPGSPLAECEDAGTRAVLAAGEAVCFGTRAGLDAGEFLLAVTWCDETFRVYGADLEPRGTYATWGEVEAKIITAFLQ